VPKDKTRVAARDWPDKDVLLYTDKTKGKQITLITKHDDRHGGPYDRGSADSYYGRGTNPHYFVGGTHQTDKIEEKDMTQSEIDAYYAGFEDNDDYK
jgi:hypothetical protein